MKKILKLTKSTCSLFKYDLKMKLSTLFILATLFTTQANDILEQGAKITQNTINGTVSDKNGVPLPGANILEKGTTNGTQTDFEGNFSIDVADENASLVISYVGFNTAEIVVNGQSTFAIVLEDDAAGLDEVVVVGYGTTAKKDVTGAVSMVDAETIENIKNKGMKFSFNKN